MGQPAHGDDAPGESPSFGTPDDEIRYWREEAERAVRRARFVELRLRAVEAQLDTLTRHIARERSAPAVSSRRPKIAPAFLLAELKALARKLKRKLAGRSGRSPHDR